MVAQAFLLMLASSRDYELHGYSPEDARWVFEGSEITNEDVIVEGNIITARGQAYAEFAVEVYRTLGFFENENEARSSLDWLKNIRPVV